MINKDGLDIPDSIRVSILKDCNIEFPELGRIVIPKIYIIRILF